MQPNPLTPFVGVRRINMINALLDEATCCEKRVRSSCRVKRSIRAAVRDA